MQRINIIHVFAILLLSSFFISCNDSGSTTFVPVTKVFLDFSVTVDNLTVNAVELSGTQGGTVVSQEWDFGDGSELKTGRNVSHTYAKSGIYTITLTGTDNFGNKHSLQRSVPAYNEVKPDFTYTKNNLTVTFTDASTVYNYLPVTYLWSFGDGLADSAEKSPVHTYADTGVYPVTLKVKDSMGVEYSIKKDVTISHAKIKLIDFSTVVTGVQVDVKNVSVFEAGEVTGWSWDFGDGLPPVIGESPAPHTYKKQGKFHITVSATDKYGLIHTMTRDVVTETTNTRPDFSYLADKLNVKFTNETTFDGTDAPAYRWDFNDGTATVLDFSPTHNYTKAGRFDVTLTATDKFGTEFTISKPITISPLRVLSDFTFDVTNRKTVTVTDATIGAIADIRGYTWDFGDGTPPVSGKTPAAHTYAKGGKYTIKLTVADTLGIPHVIEKPVTIEGTGLKSDFTFLVSGINKVQFTATNPASVYSWDFGDTIGTSTDANPSYTYTKSGEFRVTLTLTDSDGATASMTKIVSIGEFYVKPDFTFTRDGYTVNVKNETIAAAGAALTYIWNYGDSSPDSTATSHTYANVGTFDITLKVTDAYGKTYSVTKPVSVIPSADFTHVVSNTNTVAFKSVVVSLEGELTYSWNFGDGSAVVTTKDAIHIYKADGVYNVTLTAKDTFGVEYVVTKPVRILLSQIVPMFTYTTGSLSVEFKNTTVLPAGVTVKEVTWDFGDGKTGTGSPATNAYALSKIYNVKMTVKDNFDSEFSTTQQVAVLAGSNVVVAAFSYTVDGMTATFNNKTYADGTPSYEWNFGDGSAVSNDVSPTYTYTKADTFTVTLKATVGTTTSVFTANVLPGTFKMILNNNGKDKNVTLALAYSGDMYIWGKAYLGMPMIKEAQSLMKLDIGAKVKDIAVGKNHLLALTEDGDLYAWGDNLHGQLGAGDRLNQDVPIKITGFPDGTKIKTISAGISHSLAVTEGGEVYAWGRNDFYQIGQSDNKEQYNSPKKVGGLSDIVFTACGNANSFAVDKNGKAWGWGANGGALALLGTDDKTSEKINSPVQVGTATGSDLSTKKIESIASGGAHVIANAEGKLYTWGRNNDGQLGDGTIIDSAIPTMIPDTKFGGKPVTCISAAYESNSSFAITSDNKFYAWGIRNTGNFGDGNADSWSEIFPKEVPAFAGAAHVFSNSNNTFAVMTNGKTLGAGENSGYALGVANESRQLTPVQVFWRDSLVRSTMTLDFACEQAGDKIKCYNTSSITYGMDDYLWYIDGKIITDKVLSYTVNPAADVYVTMRVKDFQGDAYSVSKTLQPLNVKLMKMAPNRSFIMRKDGRIDAMGRNDTGKLGLGYTTPQFDNIRSPGTFVKMPDGVEVTALHTGEDITFAQTADNTLYSWGYNKDALSGTGDPADAIIHTPKRVEAMNGKQIKLFSTYLHALVATTDNELYVWGDNYYCQLGLGKQGQDSSGKCIRNMPTPVKMPDVPGDGEITMLRTGATFSLMKRGNKYYSWGDNSRGQLGLGDTDKRISPTEMPAFPCTGEVTDIQLGYNYGLMACDNKLYTWGTNNYGTLGQGDKEHRSLPTEVKFFSDRGLTVTKIYAYYHYGMAITSDGRLWVWGDTRYNFIPDIAGDLFTPTEYPGLRIEPDDELDVLFYSCRIRKADGTLRVFGENEVGQLGVGNDDSTPYPTIFPTYIEKK